jgi:hypothetical protein
MKPCSVEGCVRPLKARGLCGAHYESVRLSRERALRVAAREFKFRALGGEPHCSETNCARAVRARGLCARHYQRHKKAGTLPPLVGRPARRFLCAEGECGRPVYGRGLCLMHWSRARRLDPKVRAAENTKHQRSYWRNRDRRLESLRSRYKKDPAKWRWRARKWRAQNPDKAKAAWRSVIQKVTPGYVRKSMRLAPGTPIPPVLLEAKRAQLQLIRLVKEKSK